MCFGRASPREALGDAWILSNDGAWSEVVAEGVPPRPRWSHTATSVGSKVVVAGGRDDAGYVDDVYVLANRVWCRIRGKMPVFCHAAVASGDEVLVLGGVAPEDEAPDALRWLPMRGRFAHSAVVDDEANVLVVGGVSKKRGSSCDSVVRIVAGEMEERGRGLLDESLLPVHAALVDVRPGLVLVVGGGVPCFAFGPISSPSFFLFLS